MRYVQAHPRKHPHVGVDLGDDAGNHDPKEELPPRSAEGCAASEKRGSMSPGGVGDDQQPAEERAAEDDRDLRRIVDARTATANAPNAGAEDIEKIR